MGVPQSQARIDQDNQQLHAPPQPAGGLRIALFGSVRITLDDHQPGEKVTRTAQTLLAYLLLQRQRSHSRDVLASLLWGDRDEAHAHSCLNTALWRLRGLLEPPGIPRGTYLATTAAGEVGFNPHSRYWLDVAMFEAQVSRVLALPIATVPAADFAALRGALDLYVGDLLDGLYADWVLRERERLRCLYLSGLAYLMDYYQLHAAYAESLVCGQQILRHDPLREEIHRAVMRLYLQTGQRALAIRQYEQCRDTLAAELGILPMEETEALYAGIVLPATPAEAQPLPAATPPALQQTLPQLMLAIHACDQAREQLRLALGVLERLIEDGLRR